MFVLIMKKFIELLTGLVNECNSYKVRFAEQSKMYGSTHS